MTRSQSAEQLKKCFNELHRFGARLREAAVKFQQLARAGKFPERGSSFVYDRNDPATALNRSIDITRDFEFLVAVTGAFSSGKSTLLNVLLNCPDLLPASAIPLTAVCTVIRYGEKPRIQVRYVSYEECFERIVLQFDKLFKKELSRTEHLQEALEKPENFLDGDADQETLKRFARLLLNYDKLVNQPVSYEDRHAFIAGGGVIVSTGKRGTRTRYYYPTPGQEQEYLDAGGAADRWVTREWLAFIRDVTLWVDSPLLENNIAFLDLPGLNCREDYHRRAIQNYCNLADCIVVTAFQPGNQADEDVIQNFKALSSNFREKLFFVFNRIDQFQLEPHELTRSFDYLTRDCVGRDFPLSRCFLTSAYLAREHRMRHRKFKENFETFTSAFESFRSDIPGLVELLQQTTTREDPGGVDYFRDRLQTFLAEDAYHAKIDEILGNLDGTMKSLRTAASPSYEEVRRMDPRELLRSAALDYFQKAERLGRSTVNRFRLEYLRGNGQEPAAFARDLKTILERTHGEIQEKIVRYFHQPIHTAPPSEDPVSDFDLRRIADDASGFLRREFREIIAANLVDGLRARFREYLEECRLREHIMDLFPGLPEWSERLDRILERFELHLRHSVLCKIREQFYVMPGGRQLKRLERTIELAEMKQFLIRVFSEFYPDWIYQNIYGAIQDDLWLSFFLDAEDLEGELRAFFRSCRGVLNTTGTLDQVSIPEEFSEGFGDLYEVSGMCQVIADLGGEIDELKERHRRFGGSGGRLGALEDSAHEQRESAIAARG